MIWTPSHSAAPEAVPQALAVFRLTRGDFRQGLFWGGNLGRDADTIGAIVGSLAGAYSGRDSIPPEWIARAKVSAGKCIGFIAGTDVEQVAQDLVQWRLKL